MKTGHIGLRPENERNMTTDGVQTFLPQILASAIKRAFKIRYRITIWNYSGEILVNSSKQGTNRTMSFVYINLINAMAPLTTRLTLLPNHLRRGCKTAKSDHKLRHVCPSVRMKNSAFTGRIFMKSDISVFFSKMCPENSSSFTIWQE